MKRILSAFLVLVLLSSCIFSASAEGSADFCVMDSVSMTESEFRSYRPEFSFYSDSFDSTLLHKNGYYYSYLEQRYAYNGLAKTAYDSIMNNLDNEPLSGQWIISFESNLFKGMTVSEFEEIWKSVVSGELLGGVWCFRYDNPSKSDRFTDSVEVRCKPWMYENETVAKIDFFVVLEVHPQFSESLLIERDDIIDEIAAEANKKPTQYLALKYIHDRLDKMSEYDYDCVNEEDDLISKYTKEYGDGDIVKGYEYFKTHDYLSKIIFFLSHSAFGILSGFHNNNDDEVERKGVCESYAKAFMEICKKLDDAPYVGLMTSKTHMWNIVLLDGKWYCVDATWDDKGGEDVDDKYFLCGDPDKIDGPSTDHVPDGEYTIAPEYASQKYVFAPIDGDITFDGEINLLDLIRFKRISAKAYNKEFYDNADLNGDKVVNAVDLSGLKQIITK